MSLEYKAVRIYTREGARWSRASVADAVLKLVRDRGLVARVLVFKAVGGAFENGEAVSQHLLEVSYDLPLEIVIVLPAVEVGALLPSLEEVVQDGIVAVEDLHVVVHRCEKRLLPSGLRVRDVMTAEPVSVTADTPLAEVVHVLADHEFNGVPVVEGDEVKGIITQGDLVSRGGLPVRLGLFAEFDRLEREACLPSGSRPAREIMTAPVVTTDLDEPLERAAVRMAELGLKRMPVVDGEGRLRGMLARVDVLRVMAHLGPGWHRVAERGVELVGGVVVADVALHDIPVIGPDVSLLELLGHMDNEHYRVAVVDDGGRLLGLVTDIDLLDVFRAHPRGRVDQVRHAFGGRRAAPVLLDRELERLVVADVMKREFITVTEDEPLDRALRLMTEHRLKRLPVLTVDGRFCGVLSRDAVLRAGLRRSDDGPPET